MVADGPGLNAMVGSTDGRDGNLHNADEKAQGVAGKVENGRVSVTAVPASLVPDVEAEKWEGDEQEQEGPCQILSLPYLPREPKVTSHGQDRDENGKAVHVGTS